MIGYKEEPLVSQLPKVGEYWRIRGSNAIKRVKAASSGEVKFMDGTIRNMAALVERVEQEALPKKSLAKQFCELAEEIGIEATVLRIYDMGRCDAVAGINRNPKNESKMQSATSESVQEEVFLLLNGCDDVGSGA